MLFGWFTPPPPFIAPCNAVSFDKPSTPCESTGSNKLSTKSFTCLGDSNRTPVSSECTESLSPPSLLEIETLSVVGLPPFMSRTKTLSSDDGSGPFSVSTKARLALCAFRFISLISSLSSSWREAGCISGFLHLSCTARACIADSKGSSLISLVDDVLLPVDNTRSRASRIFFAFAITSAIDRPLSLFFLSLLSFFVTLRLRTTCPVGGATGGGGGGGGGTNAGGGGGGGGTNAFGRGGDGADSTRGELLPNLVLCTRLSSTGPW